MNFKKYFYLPVFLAAAFFFIAGCATVPYTERSQLMLISPYEEAQLGEQAWREFLSKNRTSTNQGYNAALRRVGENIAKAVDNRNYDWEFCVFENNEPNAFCLPGGKVGVNTGIFRYMASDAELAAVVGHEVGHVIARHGAERMSQGMVQAAGAKVIGVALDGQSGGTVQGILTAYAVTSNLGVILPYSRKHEYEADKLGMIFMSKAGYNPNGAISFWEKFVRAGNSGGEIGEFFSTHPMSEKRLEEMKNQLPEAMDIYRKYTEDNKSVTAPQPQQDSIEVENLLK